MSSYAGSVDDTATYVSYHLVKIDEETAERGKKNAKKILYRILKKPRRETSIGSAQYRKDVLISKNIITIQLDENRIYFLTVFINESDDSVDKFSFNSENADGTHYEFDIFGAEQIYEVIVLIILLCICKLNNTVYD